MFVALPFLATPTQPSLTTLTICQIQSSCNLICLAQTENQLFLIEDDHITQVKIQGDMTGITNPLKID